ncbi:BppU family phage baseplate upper protein [Bacillus cereus]|nr:BppU family phage baseplate upper protein [Bacillus cereus]
MREELLVIDLTNPIVTKRIHSRQNDRQDVSFIVHLKKEGQPVNLAGCTGKFEAVNQAGQFIREDAKIFNETKGIVMYTMSKNAVSTAGEWTAYFVFEKGNERFSTPNIHISLKSDFREGNTQIENYISDFENALSKVRGYQKQFDQVQTLLNDIQKRIDNVTKPLTSWIKLNVDTGTVDSNAPLQYKRSGDHICVIGTLKNPSNAVTLATLPIGARPPQDIGIRVNVYTADIKTGCRLVISSAGRMFLTHVPAGDSVTVEIVAKFMI